MAPQHLISPATLPVTPLQLSVLSYNVLLPNSQDGWWNYKMYTNKDFSTIDEISTWTYRQKLLKDRIQLTNPDVVCFQEVSPLSFEEDFSFMKNDLGYDGAEMFKRGRFRPATFWRTEKCHLVEPPRHCDRTLLTAFRLKVDNNDDNNEENEALKRNWHVLNCHLQAGPQGKRRVRQIDDGVKASFKMAKKLKEDDPTNPLLIVCGDFNGGEECGALHYLSKGSVGPEFIEDGEPVSSKEKKSPLSKPLIDVSSTYLSSSSSRTNAPPTLVVSELISQMIKEGTEAYEKPELSQDILDRLERIYYSKFASYDDNRAEKKAMNCSDVEKWLLLINKEVGRGSEFRCAAREMGWIEPPPTEEEEKDDQTESKPSPGGPNKTKARITLPEDGVLTLDGFIQVYQEELQGGKFWGIAYDLAIMGEALPDAGVFEARYDRMYHSQNIVPTAILDTISKEPCPNAVEPSDHLPVAASFKLN